jgi:uncharacterized protein (DUF433 family)
MMRLDHVDQYIESDPYRPGPAGARLRSSGVPVWALISYYKFAVHEDAEQTARDYELTREDVAAAIAYYHQHREAIDARIAANSSAVA